MTQRTDYLIASLVGFLVGTFAIPTFVNIGVRSKPILLVLPIATLVLFPLGIRIANFLGRWKPVFVQFGRFVAVGLLNTAIDFGILNLLSLATGVTAGLVIGGINVPGFGVAVFNSYFWNKFWVFRDRDPRESIFHDFPKFLLVTAIGLLINSGIVILVTTYATPLFGTSGGIWLNLAKAGATVVSLIWNFTGYKFFVFQRATK